MKPYTTVFLPLHYVDLHKVILIDERVAEPALFGATPVLIKIFTEFGHFG